MTQNSQSLAYEKVPKKNYQWLLATAIDAASDEGHDISELTPACLDSIDHLLKKIKKATATLPKDQRLEIIHGAAIEYASAIVAIIENETKTSGKWYYHHKTYGKDSFPYVMGEKTIFPYAWTLKTIQQPSSNSVKTKYDQLITHRDLDE